MNLENYTTTAAISYGLGSIPFGYLLVRIFKKADIRESGSGNIGATNVARSGAKGLAFATLALDALKGAAAVLVAQWMNPAAPATSGAELAAFASLCVILGHCFPVWLRFKGGKGVATALGAFIVLTPKALFIALGIFIVVVAITRYVSLGSVLAAVAVPLSSYLFGMPMRALLILSLACLIIIVKHHQNIRRLMAGQEHRWGTSSA